MHTLKCNILYIRNKHDVLYHCKCHKYAQSVKRNIKKTKKYKSKGDIL